MTKYNILKPIVLGFLTHNASYEVFIDPGVGHLEFNGTDIIWVDVLDDRFVSHTSNNAIDVFLANGSIEEIK